MSDLIMIIKDSGSNTFRVEIHRKTKRKGFSTLVAWYMWESKSSAKYRFIELRQRMRHVEADMRSFAFV